MNSAINPNKRPAKRPAISSVATTMKPKAKIMKQGKTTPQSSSSRYEEDSVSSTEVARPSEKLDPIVESNRSVEELVMQWRTHRPDLSLGEIYFYNPQNHAPTQSTQTLSNIRTYSVMTSDDINEPQILKKDGRYFIPTDTHGLLEINFSEMFPKTGSAFNYTFPSRDMIFQADTSTEKNMLYISIGVSRDTDIEKQNRHNYRLTQVDVPDATDAFNKMYSH